ncbi:MAG TPA: MOSC N-terminal beta barrel domain-containing protein [Candidatus Binatia bacterium]|nr:MOSC N-terminal beta barrel domain-containing protein [Candidatus Binatia bacterium]
MPRVARLSIAPVRALGLRHPESIDVDACGVREDRRFYLVDEHNHIVDRLRAGRLVQIASEIDPDGTWLRLRFPDGRVVEGDVTVNEPIRTYLYGREAVGHVVGGPWAPAIGEFLGGRPVRLVRCDHPGGTRIRPGETEVRNGVSLVSDGSLRELARHLGVESVDGRRFRMLIELEGAAPHEEDAWIGGRVAIGSAVLRITRPDARCAITTQDPDTGERDLDTLRTILRYRGFRADDPGKKIDFGVLGDVDVPGRISLGDELRLLGPVDEPAVADAVAAPGAVASAGRATT